MALLTQPPLNQRFHLSLEFIGSSTLNDSMATLLGRKLIDILTFWTFSIQFEFVTKVSENRVASWLMSGNFNLVH